MIKKIALLPVAVAMSMGAATFGANAEMHHRMMHKHHMKHGAMRPMVPTTTGENKQTPSGGQPVPADKTH